MYMSDYQPWYGLVVDDYSLEYKKTIQARLKARERKSSQYNYAPKAECFTVEEANYLSIFGFKMGKTSKKAILTNRRGETAELSIQKGEGKEGYCYVFDIKKLLIRRELPSFESLIKLIGIWI